MWVFVSYDYKTCRKKRNKKHVNIVPLASIFFLFPHFIYSNTFDILINIIQVCSCGVESGEGREFCDVVSPPSDKVSPSLSRRAVEFYGKQTLDGHSLVSATGSEIIIYYYYIFILKFKRPKDRWFTQLARV